MELAKIPEFLSFQMVQAIMKKLALRTFLKKAP